MTTGTAHLDALVIGTGFAGIHMLHKLRNELGLTARAVDRAGGVGGTWYWNGYPGAAADIDSTVYSYSFDRELLREWSWTSRYASQPEILAYLEHVVDRHGLRKDIQTRVTVESLVFDEASERWTVHTDHGDVLTARYVVSALGPFSAVRLPDIAGRDTFAGPVVHTGRWPAGLDITGQRVGVIGTGATGTQFICAAAPMAERLTVFQRSAQYVVPNGDHPLSDVRRAEIRETHDDIWKRAFESRFACDFPESVTPAMSVSAERRQQVFEEAWRAGGGFRFMFGTFSDIPFDTEANEAATSFIRGKIRTAVADPEVAAKLTPTGFYASRPICNTGYYETYNRDNVSLVSTRENPIARITPAGVETEDGRLHELDVLVFATGFHSMEGAYTQLDVTGTGGRTLRRYWGDKPSSYLGVAVSGFPNLFTVFGPNSVFCNMPPALETQVEWIAGLIETAEQRGAARVEATAAAEDDWTALCRGMATDSLFARSDSWLFATDSRFYLGGLASYRQKLDKIAAADYRGFTLRPRRSLRPV